MDKDDDAIRDPNPRSSRTTPLMDYPQLIEGREIEHADEENNRRTLHEEEHPITIE